jgi:hypothetical protein
LRVVQKVVVLVQYLVGQKVAMSEHMKVEWMVENSVDQRAKKLVALMVFL